MKHTSGWAYFMMLSTEPLLTYGMTIHRFCSCTNEVYSGSTLECICCRMVCASRTISSCVAFTRFVSALRRCLICRKRRCVPNGPILTDHCG